MMASVAELDAPLRAYQAPGMAVIDEFRRSHVALGPSRLRDFKASLAVDFAPEVPAHENLATEEQGALKARLRADEGKIKLRPQAWGSMSHEPFPIKASVCEPQRARMSRILPKRAKIAPIRISPQSRPARPESA